MSKVAIEYKGQIVGGCEIIRTFGFLRRGWIPVKGGYYRLRWIVRWKVIDGDC